MPDQAVPVPVQDQYVSQVPEQISQQAQVPMVQTGYCLEDLGAQLMSMPDGHLQAIADRIGSQVPVEFSSWPKSHKAYFIRAVVKRACNIESEAR